MTELTKWRVFLGIPIPQAQGRQLAAIQRSLMKPGCRPVKQKNFHITLCFLGHQKVNVIDALCTVLQETRFPTPFTARIASVAPFPEKSSRLIAATVEATEPLSELQASVRTTVRKVCDTLPNQSNNLAFKPHVTLLRKTSIQSLPPIKTDIVLPVDSIYFYRSEQLTDGVEYIKFATFKLRP